MSPFYYPDAPQQFVKIYLNGHFITKQMLSPSWQDYTFLFPQQYVQAGINKLYFEYRYAQSPKQVLGVPDGRTLSVAFDSLECVSATHVSGNFKNLGKGMSYAMFIIAPGHICCGFLDLRRGVVHSD